MTAAPSEKFRDDATETALLGAIVADPAHSGIVRAIVTADDFGSSPHATVWGIIGSLEAARAPIELRTIVAELMRREILNEVSESIHLDALPFMRVSVPRAEHYAKMIAANGRARRTARELHRALLRLDAATGADAFADSVATSILAATVRRATARRRTLPEIACDYSDHVREVVANRGKIQGLRTGIGALDRTTGGMRPEQLIVIAGRPGMGKTSLGMKIATHVAQHDHKPVAVFSLEMGDMELWERMVCDAASVDSTRVHNGDISEDDANRLDIAAGPLAALPMTIIDQGGLRTEDIRGESLRLHADGLALIVIDALGLMEHGARNGANESTVIGGTTRKLKALAKELRIPVVLLVQLSRKCEDEKRRPELRDLRDSGHIEQDADGVWLVYRDEQYHGTIEHDVPKVDRNGNPVLVNGKPAFSQRANKDIAEIIVAKQRGGRTGTVRVKFDATFTRFANLERDPMPTTVPAGYSMEQHDAWNERGEVDRDDSF